MKIKVIGSSKFNYSLSKKESMNFSGKLFNLAYKDIEAQNFLEIESEKSILLAEEALNKGYYDVFEHTSYSLLIHNVPRILILILNNENVYASFEKFDYTQIDGTESMLYNKWLEKMEAIIREVYPSLSESLIKKLANENATHFISIFTPIATLGITISLANLNRLVQLMNNYVSTEPVTSFSSQVKRCINDFIKALPKQLIIKDFDPNSKNKRLSIFTRRARSEYFSETYSTNYVLSFLGLSHAQKHTKVSYEFKIPNGYSYFYTPRIILRRPEETEWERDMKYLRPFYPQSTYINVNERGTLEDFLDKSTIDLCGHAYHEVMTQTKRTMYDYGHTSRQNNRGIYAIVCPHRQGACCTLANWKCTNPCEFGPKLAMDRLI